MGFFDFFKRNTQENKENLDKGLDKTKQSFLSKIARAILGKSTVDDEVLDNLEEVLITSDVGVETTLDFCTYVLNHEAFVSGKFDTGFIKKYFTPEVLHNNTDEFDEAIAIATSYLFENQKSQTVVNNDGAVKKSKWRENRL